MKPIINPWFFYLISLLDKVQILGIICLIAGVTLLGACILGSIELCSDEDEKAFKKCIKISILVISISALIVVVVPSKETMYEMLVANYVTENNIEAAKEDAKELVDYIVDKFEEDEE